MTQHGDDTAGRRSDVAELHLASEEPDLLLRGGALAHDSLTDDAGPEELPLDRNQAILRAAKRTGALLKQTGYPFALAGSVAVYAHGGAQNLQHDVDFCIRPEDAEAVAEDLREAGLPVRRPPEDWLLKATCLGQQVDLIFELAHQPVTTELLGRAQNLSVDSVHMPVLSPTDLMRSLMAAFSEHHCDFGAVLPIARTLREKIDWDGVRRTCAGAPMPDAFLYFLERLDVIPPQEPHKEVSR
ncbi:nucleotidyltransferase family protein [Streptomyces justiciae]|uniref:nucleotidyltransferase family protein n=1 Tax=Streptomyces justiciae TaxID=2780140 RepID=UPI0018823628|nr:nucleotidyltransferase family protein [Streptomyces justiciae]MBE8474938.1 nucleotidyltransferase family protein [Streptomyces justiciae]